LAKSVSGYHKPDERFALVSITFCQDLFMNACREKGGAGLAIGMPAGARSGIIGRRSFTIGKARNNPIIARKVSFTPNTDFEDIPSMIRTGNR
jgi:hypothetical protein